jgi:hypothetical protein
VGRAELPELVFDTLSTSRKHANRPGEQTLQDEGYREAYSAALPEGRARRGWRDLVYWRVAPWWAR